MSHYFFYFKLILIKSFHTQLKQISIKEKYLNKILKKVSSTFFKNNMDFLVVKDMINKL